MTTVCRATLNYAPPAGLGAGGLVDVDVEIRDGRAAGLPDWQECGFQLVRDPSAMKDWTDDEEIATVHYPEAEALAAT